MRTYYFMEPITESPEGERRASEPREIPRIFLVCERNQSFEHITNLEKITNNNKDAWCHRGWYQENATCTRTPHTGTYDRHFLIHMTSIFCAKFKMHKFELQLTRESHTWTMLVLYPTITISIIIEGNRTQLPLHTDVMRKLYYYFDFGGKSCLHYPLCLPL